MMKNTNIFYFDIDGTILNNETSLISEKTIEALHALKRNGYKIVVCTGRTLGGILQINLQDLIKWDMYILGNGGLILDENLEIISQQACDSDFLETLIKSYDDAIVLEGDELYATGVLSEHMQDFLRGGGLSHPQIITYKNERIQKVILENIDRIEGGFKQAVFQNYQYNINTHNLYEIFPSTVGKHHAIEFVNDYFSVKNSTFFGDGTNDIDALKTATIGVAMNNAIDSVKSVADIVTDSVSEDGIYNILKKEQII